MVPKTCALSPQNGVSDEPSICWRWSPQAKEKNNCCCSRSKPGHWLAFGQGGKTGHWSDRPDLPPQTRPFFLDIHLPDIRSPMMCPSLEGQVPPRASFSGHLLYDHHYASRHSRRFPWEYLEVSPEEKRRFHAAIRKIKATESPTQPGVS